MVVYKYVFMVEYNLVVGLCNNLFGIVNVVWFVSDVGVEVCILVFIDKVVCFMSIMGVSKWLVEMVF